jgi:hypothetical protein
MGVIFSKFYKNLDISDKKNYSYNDFFSIDELSYDDSLLEIYTENAFNFVGHNRY